MQHEPGPDPVALAETALENDGLGMTRQEIRSIASRVVEQQAALAALLEADAEDQALLDAAELRVAAGERERDEWKANAEALRTAALAGREYGMSSFDVDLDGCVSETRWDCWECDGGEQAVMSADEYRHMPGCPFLVLSTATPVATPA